MKIRSYIRKLSKFEKIYIGIFIISALAGIVYGLFDKDYFKCCEEFIGVPEGGTNPIKIFTSNYFLALTELITAGISSLYYNFHTFSIISSYLNSQGGLLTLPIILFISSFELIGSLFLALAGISFVETRIFKIKSKLEFLSMFLAGTSLIFVGAVIEYLLLTLV